MIKIWLQHKILEYCIDIVFSGFFKNFVFPKIVPQIYVNFENGIITIGDYNNEISKKTKYKPLDGQLYVGEIVDLAMLFLEKYHYTVYDIISNGIEVKENFNDTDFFETHDI